MTDERPENLAPDLTDAEADPAYVDNDPDEAPASDLPQGDDVKNDEAPDDGAGEVAAGTEPE